MLTHLIGSESQHRGFFSLGNLSLSGSLHLVLLSAAMYASVHAPAVRAREQELVSYVNVQRAPEPPKADTPEPPKAPAPAPEAQKPPPPKGFQELLPPREPPAALPVVDLSAPAVDPADFSGLGQAGGTATGVEGGTPQNTAEPAAPSEGEPGFAYEVSVLDSPPVLRNGSQMLPLLERLYPPLLLRAGIAGSVTMQFVVQPDGRVDPGSIEVLSATDPQFGDASVKVIDRMRFRPGYYKGKAVRVLVQMPIEWAPGRH